MDAASLEQFLSRTARRRVRFPVEAGKEGACDAAWAEQFESLEAARRRGVGFKGKKRKSEALGEGATRTNTVLASNEVHASPIRICEQFLSAGECEALIRLGTDGGCRDRPALWQPGPSFPYRAGTKTMLEDNAMLERIRQRAASVFGIPCNSPLSTTKCQISFTAPEPASPVNSPSIGLHVDQNNSNDNRWATVLVYLNTLPEGCGGCTVWPCVASNAAAEAGKAAPVLLSSPRASAPSVERKSNSDLVHDVDESGETSRMLHSTEDACEHLIQLGVTCTSDACHIATDETDGSFEVNLVPGTVAAAKLEADAATHGLKTAPVMGRAVCFFSVIPNSSDDGVSPNPKSYHGGLSVSGASPVGKWTLQLFAQFKEGAKGVDKAAMLRSAHAFSEKPK